MKLNCGAQRHHHSMFNVGRSMFDVQSVRSAKGFDSLFKIVLDRDKPRPYKKEIVYL
jgi:hypothetical protein